jgi:alkylation response protein AidB-like acyl-CoA dehydrogenase
VDPVTFLRIVEAASHADGSVGWCTMIGGAYSLFGGLLSAEGAREVYGDPTTISAGAFRPGGVARQVEGGLRVTGRWSLGSGSTHANWFVAGCSILRDDRPIVGPTGMPVIREVFVPAAEVTVVDTWESTGLRGTASHDYAVSDVFVPTSRTFWFQESPVCERALYRMPPVAMFATFIAAVPLGIARHALDAFASLAQTKTQDMSSVAMADRPVAQATLGRSHALVAAGRTYLIETLDDLWTRVQAGECSGATMSPAPGGSTTAENADACRHLLTTDRAHARAAEPTPSHPPTD